MIRCSARVFSFRFRLGVETVNGLDEADSAGGDEIVEFDFGTAPMQASREKLHLRDVRKDQITVFRTFGGTLMISVFLPNAVGLTIAPHSLKIVGDGVRRPGEQLHNVQKMKHRITVS